MNNSSNIVASYSNWHSVTILLKYSIIQQYGPISTTLKKATIYITNQNACRNVYRKIYDTQICANDPKTVKGACNVINIFYSNILKNSCSVVRRLQGKNMINHVSYSLHESNFKIHCVIDQHHIIKIVCICFWI